MKTTDSKGLLGNRVYLQVFCLFIAYAWCFY